MKLIHHIKNYYQKYQTTINWLLPMMAFRITKRKKIGLIYHIWYVIVTRAYETRFIINRRLRDFLTLCMRNIVITKNLLPKLPATTCCYRTIENMPCVNPSNTLCVIISMEPITPCFVKSNQLLLVISPTYLAIFAEKLSPLRQVNIYSTK
jgi:hypothetical protein